VISRIRGDSFFFGNPSVMPVICHRQRAQGARARNSEMKRPGTRDRAVRPGGAPEANAELAASLAYVRFSCNLLCFEFCSLDFHATCCAFEYG
jgi:hypothetical protein